MSENDMSNNSEGRSGLQGRSGLHGKCKRFWSLRAVLADLGVGFLVYLIIVIILLASRTLPEGFVYVAF